MRQLDQDQENISLRDYFAVHAPNPPEWWYSARRKTHPKEGGLERDAAWRWTWADAMLEMREMRGR